ncbi:voltage-dependent anion-selective channel protein 2-like [Pollicipes pollicipes]|uniref:voltage-dependent anion-selective channel protein 2-like n=1 Tax=Pollicipes pollicipes TaxID=41117 RepID=UPI00188535AD|nr:voltage-dependent anion-selective channel protein 2-like [Pollicipes pollicipes]XP_037068958.1 voltage-dependent anion-selective channel protein 2-like [Pollicipes pollicipes]
MAPPTYADLGKSSRDVFGKGFHFGLVKLEAKTTSSTGVAFTSSFTQTLASSKVLGNLETKYKCKEYGLTLTEKWNTDNTLSTDITLEDKLCKGLKLTLDTSLAPQTGRKSAVAKTTFKHDTCTLNADVNLDPAGPVVQGAMVAGYQGWLAGYQMSFDTAKSKLTKSNFALGFSAKDFTVHTSVVDGQQFLGSVYSKVSPEMEAAVEVGWAAGSNATKFSLGAKYCMDKDSSMRAKVNNSSEIGLGYQHRIRDGVTLTLSSMIDAKNFNQGGHKLGLCLELEA